MAIEKCYICREFDGKYKYNSLFGEVVYLCQMCLKYMSHKNELRMN